MSAACKWLHALAQVELLRHRDGVAILLDDVQPFGWDRAARLPSDAGVLTGLFAVATVDRV